VLVQSVDALKPLFDDPWLFARVTTEHALSDLFAMHAKPNSAQLLLQLPVLRERLLQRDLTQILQGVSSVLAAHGATLVGGHTLEADSLQIGLTVNAFSAPGSLIRKRGASPGDILILTKPLGTGTLFAAAMRGYSQARWIEAAIASMSSSNASAAAILGNAGVHALTDITGFGLAGHLREMLGAGETGARLNLNALPVLPGALECVQKGYESTLAPANQRLVRPWFDAVPARDIWRYKLLFDPQTSGGLLAAIEPAKAQRCLQNLQAAGVGACVIGECTSETSLSFDVS
jgi:selenide,water dikinase